MDQKGEQARVKGLPDLQNRTSIDNPVSENGIVAVLGDEEQFVKGDIRIVNRPFSFGRWRMGQIRGITPAVGR
jgi:hypothetical protein